MRQDAYRLGVMLNLVSPSEVTKEHLLTAPQ
jgi:hypothetical protein